MVQGLAAKSLAIYRGFMALRETRRTRLLTTSFALQEGPSRAADSGNVQKVTAML